MAANPMKTQYKQITPRAIPAFIEAMPGSYIDAPGLEPCVPVLEATRAHVEGELLAADDTKRTDDLRYLLRLCGPALTGDVTVGEVLAADWEVEP